MTSQQSWQQPVATKTKLQHTRGADNSNEHNAHANNKSSNMNTWRSGTTVFEKNHQEHENRYKAMKREHAWRTRSTSADKCTTSQQTRQCTMQYTTTSSSVQVQTTATQWYSGMNKWCTWQSKMLEDYSIKKRPSNEQHNATSSLNNSHVWNHKLQTSSVDKAEKWQQKWKHVCNMVSNKG